MSERLIASQLKQALGALDISEGTLELLASSLVWRIGRLSDESPVTVRVGLATSAQLFEDLPRLRNASEAEIEEAVATEELRVEWVGRFLS